MYCTHFLNLYPISFTLHSFVTVIPLFTSLPLGGHLSGYHALLSPGYRQTQHNGVFANSPAPPPAMKSFQPGESPNSERVRRKGVKRKSKKGSKVRGEGRRRGEKKGVMRSTRI